MSEEKKPELPDLEALMRAGKPRELMAALGEYIHTVNRTFRPTGLAQSLQSFRATVAALKKDTDRCQARYQAAFSAWFADKKNQAAYELLQFELRQLIRTFFAEVDGTVYSGRQIALWAHERGEVELSAAELALLREESYRFNRKTKKAESRPAFGSTLDALLLTFTVFPRLFKVEPSLDLSHHGWESFQKLLEVRNTITHPKDLIYLLVDVDVILKVLPAARAWYYSALTGAVRDPLLPDILRGAV